jgi:hypothetical protein
MGRDVQHRGGAPKAEGVTIWPGRKSPIDWKSAYWLECEPRGGNGMVFRSGHPIPWRDLGWQKCQILVGMGRVLPSCAFYLSSIFASSNWDRSKWSKRGASGLAFKPLLTIIAQDLMNITWGYHIGFLVMSLHLAIPHPLALSQSQCLANDNVKSIYI